MFICCVPNQSLLTMIRGTSLLWLRWGRESGIFSCRETGGRRTADGLIGRRTAVFGRPPVQTGPFVVLSIHGVSLGSRKLWSFTAAGLPDVLPNSFSAPQPPKEDIVLCKIYRKATSLKELEQRAVMEESRASQGCTVSAASSDQENLQKFSYDNNEGIMEMKVEFEVPPVEINKEVAEVSSAVALLPSMPLATERSSAPSKPSALRPPPSPASQIPTVRQLPSLPALQVPNHTSFDLAQDSFLSQLRSPWLDQWSPLYASLLNF